MSTDMIQITAGILAVIIGGVLWYLIGRRRSKTAKKLT
jgi:hypothetical protein